MGKLLNEDQRYPSQTCARCSVNTDEATNSRTRTVVRIYQMVGQSTCVTTVHRYEGTFVLIVEALESRLLVPWDTGTTGTTGNKQHGKLASALSGRGAHAVSLGSGRFLDILLLQLHDPAYVSDTRLSLRTHNLHYMLALAVVAPCRYARSSETAEDCHCRKPFSR